MRKIFGVEVREAIPFIVCAVIYAVVTFVWLVVPLVASADGALVSIADSDMPFIRNVIPLVGDLPPQSISRLIVSALLYIMALVYALWSLVAGGHGRTLPMFVGLSVLTFAAWMALNFWVIAGFLSSPNVLLLGGASVLLLIVWGGGMMRFVSTEHDPMALFLVRFGLGLAAFITIVQVIALATPEWRSPTQGVPVLYTLTFNGFVGVFLAGAGGNMLWRERRAQVLAAASKRR
jgi:hypothetical protein